MKKERLDKLLVDRGFIASREKAQRLIMAGEVSVNDQLSGKPGIKVPCDAQIILKSKPRFVSRGGDKLECAFNAFKVDVSGKTCVDIGSSTGGFTDCLLQHGAARVFCIDVGKGQLDWGLRNDSRVIVMEKINARYLKPGDLPVRPHFATVDVSFISLTKVLPAVINVLESKAFVVTLIKPQFEAERSEICRGGVVRSAQVRERVVDKIRDFATDKLGICSIGLCESDIHGPAGNIEYLALFQLA